MTHTCPNCGHTTPTIDPFHLVVTGQSPPGAAPRLETTWAAIRIAVAKNPGIAQAHLAHHLNLAGIARPATTANLARAAALAGHLERVRRADGTPRRIRHYLYPPKENP